MAKTRAQPVIPDKKYFTIGEVSRLCRIKPHVLRYWEQEFSQLRPTKRRGNRRYYRRQDIQLIQRIQELLYSQGYTINGARSVLNHQAFPYSVALGSSTEERHEAILSEASSQAETVAEHSDAVKLTDWVLEDCASQSRTNVKIRDVLDELERLLRRLTAADH